MWPCGHCHRVKVLRMEVRDWKETLGQRNCFFLVLKAASQCQSVNGQAELYAHSEKQGTLGVNTLAKALTSPLQIHKNKMENNCFVLK